MPYTPLHYVHCKEILCPSPGTHKSAARRRVENSTGCPENRQQPKEQQQQQQQTVRKSGWKTVWPVTHNNSNSKAINEQAAKKENGKEKRKHRNHSRN